MHRYARVTSGVFMPYCPKCRGEYREGYTRCKECDADLVEQLPEEREERVEGKPPVDYVQRVRFSRFFPIPVDKHAAARRVEVLCWVLIATAFSFLLYQSVIYIDFYFSLKPWETEPALLFNASMFFNGVFSPEDFLALVLVLLLCIFLIRSRRVALLRLITFIAIFFAIWFLLDLVLLIITTVKYSVVREQIDMGMLITLLVQLGIISFIGAATAGFARKLRKAALRERAENE